MNIEKTYFLKDDNANLSHDTKQRGKKKKKTDYDKEQSYIIIQ